MDFEKQYLTYEEYKGLGGSLDQTPFNILEFKARKIVDKYTFGRLKDLISQIKEVKMCVYELIGSSLITSDNKGVASESIDGYSVNYEQKTTDKIKADEKEAKMIVLNNLSDCYLENGTPYLWRGTK